jgi:hypothetical protein
MLSKMTSWTTLWALLALLSLGCGPHTNTTTPLPATSTLDPDTVVVLLHGYISSADQFTKLQKPLEHGISGHQPLHVHSFDYSAFSRVGFDHNLGVERLGEVLAATVRELPDHCAVCAERHAAVQQGTGEQEVVFLARSFGGLILREALMDPGGTVPPGWSTGSVMTLGTPFFGSELTRYSTGFLSVVINGGIRTALFGFINPRRGGTFGNVIDAQVRAMRLGSPYQVHAHERWAEFTAAGKAPPWALVASVGSSEPVDEGDRVVRFSSANAAGLYPGWEAETLLIDVRHSRLFNARPRRHEAAELERLLGVIRDWVDRPTLSGRGALAPRSPVADAPPFYVFPGGRAERKLAALVRADQGDLWLRLWRGSPERAEPLHPARDLGPFQVGEEWSRRWQEVRVEEEQTADGVAVPTVLAAGPLASHMVFLPDLTPSGDWTVEVELDGQWAGPGAVHTSAGAGPKLTVRPLQNNVVDVYIEAPPTARLTDLRLLPGSGRDRR